MSLLLKDPEAALDYVVDWGSEYLGDDFVLSSGWTLQPAEDGGLAIVTDGFDAQHASVTLSGGVAGKLYRLTNRIGTAAGRSDSRSFTIRVEKR